MENTQTLKTEDVITIKGEATFDFYNVKTKKHEIIHVKNLITTLAKESLAQALVQSLTRGFITYAAVGTSAVAPALGDSRLGVELYRKLISVRSAANNVATFQTFFSTSEANGTLREAGLFGDSAASAVANTGILFSHLAINRTKSSNDTLTLTWTITVG